jgi:integrase
MLRHAAQWGVVHQNVATLVDAPSVQEAEIDILTPGEVQAVLRTLKGRPIYALATVVLGTGMRRGAMLALRWQDVEFESALLRVEQSLEQTTKHGMVVQGTQDEARSADNHPAPVHCRRTTGSLAHSAGTPAGPWPLQGQRRVGIRGR